MWRWLAARREQWRGLLILLGGWPARRVTWTLAVLVSAWAITDLLVLRVSSGLARSTYDTMVRSRFHAAPVDPRLVIVDIDEASLARMGREFGRWPWPRDTLATVLDHLERQQPAAIVWDILFSDPDRLNPGGDAAFDAAAARSRHSHFPVVRLPSDNDGFSRITRERLPNLWLPQAGAQPGAAIAVIPPAFKAIAASRLGYNNGYVDADGVLRRYRYAERQADGGIIQSIALSVLREVDPARAQGLLERVTESADGRDELISWRSRSGAYPRVSFADLFAQADGSAGTATLPSFAGRIIIIGSTAPSLHDIHPSPLSPYQPGVDSLATAIDNALNSRHVSELPRWVQAAIAVALCLALALWVQFRALASLQPVLIALPAVLIAVSYLTLNVSPLFLDLYLAAGVALLLMAVLRYWVNLRRDYWCALPRAPGPWLMCAWQRDGPWDDEPLDRLFDVVERHLPDCRVVAIDAIVTWPVRLRWPELARSVAIVGPAAQIEASRAVVLAEMKALASEPGPTVQMPCALTRTELADTAFRAWTKTLPTAKTPDIEEPA